LKDLQHVVTLVDGTLLKGLPVLAQAALADSRAVKAKAKWRLHTQFDLQRGVPIRIDLTEGNAGGESDERAVLQRALDKGHCYVTDRGYAKFALFNAIAAAESSYVCRCATTAVTKSRRIASWRRKTSRQASSSMPRKPGRIQRRQDRPIIRCDWSS